MGSDLARITFDPTRQYRSVVTQQGRVTLEADVNEQNTIASEALRLETIDLVGGAATPDDGYKVTSTSNGLQIGKGTMYLGGWRLTTDDVLVSSQPDWIDAPQSSLQTNVAVLALLATEQDVSATEDQALREVALGGPDTGARTRLMQHFVDISVQAETCAAAEAQLGKDLTALGFVYNPTTHGLHVNATLLVSFFPPQTSTDACCPPAQGGYLGSDNQLVRVTITAYDATSGSGTLLWSWNNASFLYRASVVNTSANPQVLKLGQTPVDAEHTPQPGQAIEVLRTTKILDPASENNFVADPAGTVITLGAGTVFDPGTNQLTLPGTPLSGGYLTDKTPLFVRLWQAQVPFTNGKPAQLDSQSGLAVTINMKANLPSGQLAVWPFWEFAVRPNTPQQVYPQRYLESAQNPDGPRQWICDLAIVAGGKVVADCRNHFPDKEPSCDCCSLVLDPTQDWLGTLNAALSNTSTTAVSVCFQPGQFAVPSKITASGKAIKMTGAGSGTVLTGSSLEAVMEFDSCPSVSLSDFSVVAGTAGYSNNPATANLQGAITVRSCNQVDIERMSLACADGELRSASCLAVYNSIPAASAAPQQYNVRVLNSQFKPGHCQVGVLMVNADRAQIEGNLVVTAPTPLNIGIANLSSYPLVASRIAKQLVHGFTLVDTAPKTKKALKRQLKKQKKRAALLKVSPQVEQKLAPAVETVAPAAAAPSAATSQPQAGVQASATQTPAQNVAATINPKLAVTIPPPNLGLVGRAHVTATFGTFKIQFVSSEKLNSAWTDAIRSAGLTATSTAGAIHSAIKSIAKTIVTKPETVSAAFRNYLTATLPQLFSTSSQGIVIGGNLANDIRILNNTIEGTAQGIHVGLSDLKLGPNRPPHQIADRVLISGNRVNIRLTPEMTGDRHGIFLGCVTSGAVFDNHVELTRQPNAGQDIYGIKILGYFGTSLLIERNCILNFTNGVVTLPDATSTPAGVLWKVADNASTSKNIISPDFRSTDNVP